MKRFFFTLTAFVTLPLGAAVGCNAILGNAAGTLDDEDATMQSQCEPTQKSCVGSCVEQNDPTVGCSGPCSACPSPVNGQSACNLAGNKYNCGLGACNAQYGDCDNNPSDGCETHTTVRAYCGDCSTDCGSEFCEHQGSAYVCSATCDSPNIVCGADAGNAGECIDPTSDNANCGGCGVDCTVANGRGTCANSACSVACDTSYFLCGGQCVLPNPSQCGGSCAPCPSLSLCDTTVGSPTYGTCVDQDSGAPCPSGKTCGTVTMCCNNSTDNCCPAGDLSGGSCTTENATSCGPSCDNCGPAIGDVDGGACDLSHQCSCGSNQRCGMSPQYWCCATTDTCGAGAGSCVPKSTCNPPGDCTISGSNCGCLNSSSACVTWDTPAGCGTACAVCEAGAPSCNLNAGFYSCGPNLDAGSDSGGPNDAGGGPG